MGETSLKFTENCAAPSHISVSDWQAVGGSDWGDGGGSDWGDGGFAYAAPDYIRRCFFDESYVLSL